MSGWHKLTERLPDEGGYYFVMMEPRAKKNRPMMARWDINKQKFFIGKNSDVPITRWHLLPDLPTE